MGSKQLEKLLEKREALQARIRREEAKARGRERRDDTRRKILTGAAVMAWAEHDAAFKAQLRVQLAGFLVRADDRALFGLPVLASDRGAAGDAPGAETGERNVG